MCRARKEMRYGAFAVYMSDRTIFELKSALGAGIVGKLK